ncbi:MAG TPA: nuclear transport factor 2 family protein [Sphingomicrobium sp.]|nr:nuclear transport factor 2 family protein [Sphingomicrobium sp.]
MADILPMIETLENRFMRAWVGGDGRVLKELTARNFRLVMGSKPCAILDAKSWLDAAGKSFTCERYRFGDIYARDLGGTIVFATQLEMTASIDGQELAGRMWVTDVWMKSRVRRRWRMVERLLSRPEEDKQVPAAIKSLQLWQRPAKR